MTMAAPINDDEKPLDPAVERVRRKLLRFVAINLGLLLVALMAVIGAIVYKWEPGGAHDDAGETAAFPAGDGGVLTGDIALPTGARVLSHGISGNRITLHVEAGGAGSILIYDIGEGRIIGRFDFTRE
jgi:hypothetical protein